MKHNIRHAAASIVMVTLAHSGAIAQTTHRTTANGGLTASTQLGSRPVSTAGNTTEKNKQKTPTPGALDASPAAANSATAGPLFGGVGTPVPQAGVSGHNSTTQQDPARKLETAVEGSFSVGQPKTHGESSPSKFTP